MPAPYGLSTAGLRGMNVPSLAGLVAGDVPVGAAGVVLAANAATGRVARTAQSQAADYVSVKDYGAVGGNLGTTIADAGWDLATVRTQTGQAWLQSADTCDLAAFYMAQRVATSVLARGGLKFPADRYVFSSPGFVHPNVDIDLDGSEIRTTELATWTRGNRVFLLGINSRNDYPRYAAQGWEYTCANITKGATSLTSVSGGAWTAGDAIMLRSTAEDATSPTAPIPTIVTYNEVVSYSSGTMVLKYPVEQAITSPKLINFSSNTTLKSSIASGGEPHVYYCCANSKLRNGTLVGLNAPAFEFNATLNTTIDVKIRAPRGMASYGNGLCRSSVKVTGTFGGDANYSVELGTGSSLSMVDVDIEYSGDTYNADAGTPTDYALVKVGENSFGCEIKGRIRGGTKSCGQGLLAIGIECNYNLDLEGEGVAGALVLTSTGSLNERITGRYKSSSCSYHADFNGTTAVMHRAAFVGIPVTNALRFQGSNNGRVVGCDFPSKQLVFTAATSGNSVVGSYVALPPAIWGTNYADIMTASGPWRRGGASSTHTIGGSMTVDDCGDNPHHNSGATGIITLIAPSAAPGMKFRCVRIASFAFRIDPNGSQVIGAGGAGKYISLDSDFATLAFECIFAGRWEVVGSYGTHSYET